MTKIVHNNVLRDMTTKEQSDYDALQTEWSNNSTSRKLNIIKQLRLDRLKSTDWMSVSDVTMPSYIKTWRQTLRDLPANHTDEDAYNLLLATENDKSNADYGKLTHSVWTQPTS